MPKVYTVAELAKHDLEKNSVDYYVALRSLSAQRRAARVEEGKTGGLPADEDETDP
jgi:ABC-type transporter lipoprotein component MlaA